MPVTVKVNGAANSLVHREQRHFNRDDSDVCKTPTSGRSVPMPYPISPSRPCGAKGRPR